MGNVTERHLGGSEFGVTFNASDGETVKVSGIVKLLVRTTGYRPIDDSPTIVDTKNGKALKIYYQVLDGDHKGAIIEDFINFTNASPQCQNIGRARLKSLAHSLGWAGIEEFNSRGLRDLKGKLLTAEVYTKDAEGDYPAKNCVKKYVMADSKMGTSNETPDNKLKDEMPDF